MLLFWQNKQFEDMILGCPNSDGHFETFSGRLGQLIGQNGRYFYHNTNKVAC